MRYQYDKTMVFKIKMADPDYNGGSKLYCDVENALEIIKSISHMTWGCPMIVYLVGWQYDGHDDKYPAFFEINERIKRKVDSCARDSLLWLTKEAKNYNATVSYHINLTDAYPCSPIWNEYVQKDLILKNRKGKLMVTGIWGGRESYGVVLEKELKSGLFEQRVNRLFDLLPLEDVGTVHIDAFFVRKGHNVRIKDEKKARLKMIQYFNMRGVDVTSEFIYREHKSGFRAHFGDSDTIGIIPFYWNPVYSRRDILKHPASVLAGGKHCKSLSLDKSIEWLIYGNIRIEGDVFEQGKWKDEFLKDFVTYNLPYFYLNSYDRMRITGIGKCRKLIHSNNVVTTIKNKMISNGGVIVKKNDFVWLPLHYRENCYIAYNDNSGICNLPLQNGLAEISTMTENGRKVLLTKKVDNQTLQFDMDNKKVYYIRIHKE